MAHAGQVAFLFARDGAPADVAAAEAFRPVDGVDRGIGARLRLGDVVAPAR
jgi:hypothetical protein